MKHCGCTVYIFVNEFNKSMKSFLDIQFIIVWPAFLFAVWDPCWWWFVG